jgi:hypothetical protein
MKILVFSLIIIFASFAIVNHQVFADNSYSVQIQEIQVQPSTIRVGNDFNITATLVNNSTDTISVHNDCLSPFSVAVDSHATIDVEKPCIYFAISKLIKPGEKITVHGPGSNIAYRATDTGVANATITFSYTDQNQSNSNVTGTGNSTSISKSVLFTISPQSAQTKSVIQSPLEQFRSGIAARDVKCNEGLEFIQKNENGQPACVKPQTMDKLIERGGGIIPLNGLPSPYNTTDKYSEMTLVNQTFLNQDYNSTGTTRLPISFMPCDTPYPKSDSGISVLYMPTNSIGKLCVRYTNYNSFPDSFRGGIRIFDPNNSYQSVPDVTTWSDLRNITTIQGGQSFIVTYWIKTGNQTGFYGLDLFCGGTPFAIGYDNGSKLVSSDFPFVGLTYSCPAILHDTRIDSTTGIGVKYVPFP